MTRAFLGLGSNLGDRRDHLRSAIETMPDVVAVSGLYETDPVGGPEQGAYLNLVVELDTDLTARELLELCRTLERGRGPGAARAVGAAHPRRRTCSGSTAASSTSPTSRSPIPGCGTGPS